MPNLVLGVMLIALLLLLGGIVGPRLARKRVQAHLFTAPPLGSARPADLGLAYQQLTIPLSDHQLQAWFVPASQPIASLLLFHGHNDALSSLVAAIARLHQQQLTVMVFNYSGHGESTGRPTIERVRADSAAAYALFRAKVAPGPTFVLGYSLGAAVLLDALRHHAMDVDGVILASPFSSVRAVAVADGLPVWLSLIIPDVYNNVQALAAVAYPVLIVHSETDGTFPLSMAQQMHAAGPATELAVVASPRHAEVLASPATIGDQAEAYWQAIFGFIKQHAAENPNPGGPTRACS
jgi:pimeloyl-ACP methyl ester carboxylesterase